MIFHYIIFHYKNPRSQLHDMLFYDGVLFNMRHLNPINPQVIHFHQKIVNFGKDEQRAIKKTSGCFSARHYTEKKFPKTCITWTFPLTQRGGKAFFRGGCRSRQHAVDLKSPKGQLDITSMPACYLEGSPINSLSCCSAQLGDFSHSNTPD